jgi:hypothetical protein
MTAPMTSAWPPAPSATGAWVGDMREWLGVETGPARQRCASRSLHALHQGIGGSYTGRLDDEDEEEACPCPRSTHHPPTISR